MTDDAKQAAAAARVFNRIVLFSCLAGAAITMVGNAVLETSGGNIPLGMTLRTIGMAIMFGMMCVFLLVRMTSVRPRSTFKTPWFAIYRDGTLVLSDSTINDADVEKAVSLYPQLTVLSLEGSGITDEALQYLARLRRLEHLNLRRTRVTDLGLEHLESLTTLRRLVLAETQVTDRGVQLLQTMLPNCEIVG